MEMSESDQVVDDLIRRLGGALLDAEEILAAEAANLCPRGKASAHRYVSLMRNRWARGLACVRRYAIRALDTSRRYAELENAEKRVDAQLAECRQRVADTIRGQRAAKSAFRTAKDRTRGLNAAKSAMQSPRLSEAETQADEVTVEAYAAVERTELLFPMVHEITPASITVEASINRAFASDVPIQGHVPAFQNEKAALNIIDAALKQ